MKYLFLLTATALIASCSIKDYSPPLEGSFATVSFSNLTQQTPELRIIDRCSASKIDNSLIEFKETSHYSKHRLKIPANRKITFEYRLFWVAGDKTEVISQVSKGSGLANNTILEKRKAVDSCKMSFTFIPEESKYYEVYFGKGVGKCVLGVGEVYIKPENKQKSLYKVKAADKQDC